MAWIFVSLYLLIRLFSILEDVCIFIFSHYYVFSQILFMFLISYKTRFDQHSKIREDLGLILTLLIMNLIIQLLDFFCLNCYYFFFFITLSRMSYFLSFYLSFSFYLFELTKILTTFTNMIILLRRWSLTLSFAHLLPIRLHLQFTALIHLVTTSLKLLLNHLITLIIHRHFPIHRFPIRVLRFIHNFTNQFIIIPQNHLQILPLILSFLHRLLILDFRPANFLLPFLVCFTIIFILIVSFLIFWSA